MSIEDKILDRITALPNGELLFPADFNDLATGIVLFHNHPSGRLTPSQTDKDLTRKMKDAAKLYGYYGN
ncbi:MAG TPA: JAB domain-containing protein [Lutibacter sp.]